ncbi:MAG: DegT/DnrJ/EryC1/StrS family aminotransferase [Bradyrhizobium sp.]|nr:DegT/DnrJ/EryC1/StrS family aminotransferase [Bradyrhizobium sp.]
MTSKPDHEAGANLPYGRHSVDEEDVSEVVRVLSGDWLTTGPEIRRFEQALEEFLDVPHCVAVSSGTAALHCAMQACDVGPGDEVLVPALTFAASANAALYVGATPIFVDVEPDTLLVDVASVSERITERTKAIVAVDYAGQMADYDGLNQIARERGIAIVADRCHSIGARHARMSTGSIATASAFSFHPVKHITSGEGGVVALADPERAAAARRFRNHGITTDHRERDRLVTHSYDMVDLGYNYRLTDLQAALGRSQLRRLPGWLARRREIAARYDTMFAGMPWLVPLSKRVDRDHAYHIYVVALKLDRLTCDRDKIFEELRANGIGANVHYVPVYLHSFYRKRLGCQPGLCPVAEVEYRRILTLPLYPAMTESDIERVVATVDRICRKYSCD